jgi:hypothetical protein
MRTVIDVCRALNEEEDGDEVISHLGIGLSRLLGFVIKRRSVLSEDDMEYFCEVERDEEGELGHVLRSFLDGVE